MTLNRDAMRIPAGQLVDALEERIVRKRETLAERDRRFGTARNRVYSYMENLGWPPLFGYDMNRFYQEPEFMLEQEFRQRIFWLDNTLGDELPSLDLCPTTGFYWDITLFGQRIRTTPGGVPEFLPHPLARSRDLSLLQRYDFQTSGEMPVLLHQHRELRRLSAERSGGRIGVGFPWFHRGPLDILVQLRGYENFVFDTMEAPDFVHQALSLILAERYRWNQERTVFLGETFSREATFIADDWINPPFISPGIFRDFVLPAYRAIQANEGPVTGVHTCGPLVPLVEDMLAALPAIRTLDVSGWNDLEKLDAVVDPALGFSCQMRNTFVLCGTEEEHRAVLATLRRIASRRRVDVGAQSIVMLHPNHEENFVRLTRFIELARKELAG